MAGVEVAPFASAVQAVNHILDSSHGESGE
jgi:hypothetical protein